MSRRITIPEWEQRLKIINSNMDLLTKELSDNPKTQTLTVYCNKCGATIERHVRVFSTLYSNHKNMEKDKNWCPCCSGAEVFQGINDLATTRPDLMKYLTYKEDGNKYTFRANIKVSTTCPECGYQKLTNLSNLSGYGFTCQMCSDTISYPNKICRELLKLLPVDEFDVEYDDNWTMDKSYDGYFRLGDRKYLLEFDGAQHYRSTVWASVEEQEKNDLLKTQLAKDNNYILIRIDCRYSSFDYIKKKIYETELSKLFDLDNINWNIIEELSINNQFLQIVDYYKTHIGISAIEIAKVFNVERHSIYRTLKRANSLGLIEYDPSKSRQTSQKKLSEMHRRNSKKIYTIYNSKMEYVNEFYLIADCSRYLNSLYPDRNYDKGSIKLSIKNNKLYKGYYFKSRDRNAESLIQEICMYFLNNQHASNYEIAKIFDVSDRLVTRYLSFGIENGIIERDKLSQSVFKHGRLQKYA